MPNNPFVKPAAPPANRLLPARTRLSPTAGVPAGECLNNWMPEQLHDGALCYVIYQRSLYIFDKFSTLTPYGTSIIATMAGSSVPGRWLDMLSSFRKSYSNLSYAYPNQQGDTNSITCIPLVTDTWTAFEAESTAAELGHYGDFTFDNDKTLTVGRSMYAEISWFMSYAARGNYLWFGAVMLNIGAGTYIQGSVCQTYYDSEAVPDQPMYMGASCIYPLAQGNTLQLAVKTQGVLSEPDLTAFQCGMIVKEL
jgi:hypothetical protein